MNKLVTFVMIFVFCLIVLVIVYILSNVTGYVDSNIIQPLQSL